jgi:hypothetical protein
MQEERSIEDIEARIKAIERERFQRIEDLPKRNLFLFRFADYLQISVHFVSLTCIWFPKGFSLTC